MHLPTPDRIGVFVVDHGSRRAESNEMLLEVVQMFQQRSGYTIVEPAHMELAEPTIADRVRPLCGPRCGIGGAAPVFPVARQALEQDIPEPGSASGGAASGRALSWSPRRWACIR
jgi:sirohydrochlorin ferrochelatase